MAKGQKFEYPLAFVTWEDAYSHDDWVPIADARSHTPCIVQSVGWLVDESDRHITIIQSITSDEAGSRITIPKVYIKNLETLMGSGRWRKVINEDN